MVKITRPRGGTSYFIGCPHFGHSRIIEYCNRPFPDVYRMDEAIIENWNSVVGERDDVWVLGDFTLDRDAQQYFRRLNGRIYVLEGDHDKKWMQSDRDHCSRQQRVILVPPIYELIIPIPPETINIVLCHYPIRKWRKSHYNSWHLYAHCHGRDKPIGKSWEVSVENTGYFPLSLDEIIGIMKNRPDNPNLIKR